MTEELKKRIGKLVRELVSEDAVPISEYLVGKKNISEFVVAEEVGYEIHKTRFILYKLLEHNIASFIRKKDRIKGWYICYWNLNVDQLSHIEQKLVNEKIEKLRGRLEREQDHQFYMCRSAHARLEFGEAVENDFKCPECGEIMNIQDNNRTIEFLRQRIQELEQKADQPIEQEITV